MSSLRGKEGDAVGETEEPSTSAVETVVSDAVETALRKLLSEEVVELTKAGRGGAKCWPAVLLEIAARQSRTPDAPRHAVAHLIAQALDLRRPVSEGYRMEVARFCRGIVEQARPLGLGRLQRLRKRAKSFIEQLLKDGTRATSGHVLGRLLTIQQLIFRMDPHQPFEVQARAVKSLPDFVNLELRNASDGVQERQKTLQTLDRAVGMVGGTKYFESLTPQMREACESRMNGLRHRIEKAGRRR